MKIQLLEHKGKFVYDPSRTTVDFLVESEAELFQLQWRLQKLIDVVRRCDLKPTQDHLIHLSYEFEAEIVKKKDLLGD